MSPTAMQFCRLRVLVVDANQIRARAAVQTVAAFGYRACSASLDLSAVDIATAFQPDVVLIAVGRNQAETMELATRLRESPTARQPTMVAELAGHSSATAENIDW